MLQHITFVTIGQTPRTDLVPEIVRGLGGRVEVDERGALDGVEPHELPGLAPGPQDHALVTRFRDGGQAVIGKKWVTGRLQEILDGIACRERTRETYRDGASATVLLCTGDFPGLTTSGLFLDAQHLVDHGTDALCHAAGVVGLLVPLERQEAEHHYAPAEGQRVVSAYASPYEDADFEAAGRALAGCDLVVMHCMGYTEEQRAAVAKGSGRPVLLARRLVAAAIGQLL
jgi:protein AroM